MRECTNKRFVIVKRIIKSIIIYLHILTFAHSHICTFSHLHILTFAHSHINLSFVLFSLNLRLVHHRTRCLRTILVSKGDTLGFYLLIVRIVN